MKKLISLSIAILMLAGCASVPLTQVEQDVRILRKSDAPADCKEVGKVHAPGFGSISDEGRESDLRRATNKIGGNTVSVDRRDENNTIFGTAYSCPKMK